MITTNETEYARQMIRRMFSSSHMRTPNAKENVIIGQIITPNQRENVFI
jgi:hypothetical protein